jgi:hypothetical protein
MCEHQSSVVSEVHVSKAAFMARQAHTYLQSVKKPTLVKQGVCHTAALPFTLKSILRQKKNYGNSIISPCKKNLLIFKKIL